MRDILAILESGLLYVLRYLDEEEGVELRRHLLRFANGVLQAFYIEARLSVSLLVG